MDIRHSMYMYKQLLFCNVCGFRGSSQLRKLASRCTAPTEAGLRALKELRAGTLPSGGAKNWPVDRLSRDLANQAALPIQFP